MHGPFRASRWSSADSATGGTKLLPAAFGEVRTPRSRSAIGSRIVAAARSSPPIQDDVSAQFPARGQLQMSRFDGVELVASNICDVELQLAVFAGQTELGRFDPGCLGFGEGQAVIHL